MPVIYEYLGIVIRLYVHDHEPIHIHAEYGDNAMKVSLLLKDGKIYRTTYSEEKGSFSPAKLKQLKEFVSQYKYAMVYAWNQIVVNNVKVKKMTITKKI